MKYQKPRIAVLASAAECVQGGIKHPNNLIDMSFQETIGAYEADE